MWKKRALLVVVVGLSVFLPMEGIARETRPREPLLHGLASFLVPGLGQYLNDEPDKALIHFAVAVAIPLTCRFLIPDYELRSYLTPLFQLGWHVYSAVDAYKTAEHKEKYGFDFKLPQPGLDLEWRGGQTRIGLTFNHPVLTAPLTLSSQSLTEPTKLAYQILGELAETKRKGRMLEGKVRLTLGVTVGVVGGIIETQFWPVPWISLTFGGILIMGGLANFRYPTAPELEYERITKLPPEEREIASRISLKELARAAYERRIYQATSQIAFGLAGLIWASYNPSYFLYLTAISNITQGIYYFLVPSEEEQALQRYQELKSYHTNDSALSLPGYEVSVGTVPVSLHNRRLKAATIYLIFKNSQHLGRAGEKSPAFFIGRVL